MQTTLGGILLAALLIAVALDEGVDPSLYRPTLFSTSTAACLQQGDATKTRRILLAVFPTRRVGRLERLAMRAAPMVTATLD